LLAGSLQVVWRVQWLLLAVGWFTLGSVAWADQQPAFELAIRLAIDQSIASRLAVNRVQSEAAAIWEPYRVHLVWIDANAAAAPQRSRSTRWWCVN
jgi:hypothetical protein